MGALNSIRVIDFGHYIAGPLAAGLLADFGADVVRIEPPGGPALHTPANATWNRSKRSIVLDLKNPSENAIARQLVAQADVVVENFRPDVMKRLGLGPDAMLSANPQLVYCSLPGFANDDPRAGIAAWEGVVAAATNTYRVPPDGSAPPSFTSLPIASNFAAFLAAAAVVAALIARERDGLGQVIEVPLFSAMYTAWGTFNLLPPTQIPLDAPPRAFDPYGGGLYRCADGQWVLLSTFRFRFLEWFLHEAELDALRDEGLVDPQWSLATSDRLRARLTQIFATRPAEEWEDIGNRAGVPMSRVRTPAEWLQTEHALVSGIVAQIDDPEYGPMRVPGIPVRLEGSPAIVRARRPRDTDRETILAELKSGTRHAGLPAAASTPISAALEGMRVLDLSHMLAGPAAARLLAEFGAEVIKITDPDDAHFTERFHRDVNRGKRTILLNLHSREGLEVFFELVQRSDVVLHNLAYEAADRLGIGYEALQRLRPDIVYGSISACGAVGPWRARRGYEPHGSALTGLMSGAVPAMPPFGVNDWGSGVLGAFAVLLGLLHRVRTGEGQQVEASLVQTATWHQTASLYQYSQVESAERQGTTALGWGPLQRLYRASDGWFFLGASAADLERLEIIPELVGISEQREEALASFLEGHLAMDTARRWVERLNGVGVGAHILAAVEEVKSDPWALSRGLVLTRDRPGAGAWTTIGPTIALSRTPLRPGRPSPPLGADLPAVLGELGRGDQLDELIEKGAASMSYAAERPV